MNVFYKLITVVHPIETRTKLEIIFYFILVLTFRQLQCHVVTFSPGISIHMVECLVNKATKVIYLFHMSWTQNVYWRYIKCSKHVLDVFWKPSFWSPMKPASREYCKTEIIIFMWYWFLLYYNIDGHYISSSFNFLHFS